MKEDLDYYLDYIRRDSVFYADRFAEKIILTAQRLESFPESGRKIPECEWEDWRVVILPILAINFGR